MTDSVNKTFVMSRTLVLVYGVLSYFIGVAGLLCIIATLAKLMPFGFLNASPTALPILWNVVLVVLWGLIHTVMARDQFKSLITKFIPNAAERPTYVLLAGITSILLVGLWQHVPGIVWGIANPTVVIALWSLFVFGWVYLLASTFAINHFDLFGLRQVYLNFKNQPEPPLAFTKRAMYKFTRHPIQTGVLIGVWAIPTMTVTHIILSLGFTIYIFIGLWFEEKDLLKDIGEPYAEYRLETGKVLPKLFGREG